MKFTLQNIIEVLGNSLVDEVARDIINCFDETYEFITNNSKKVIDNSLFVAIEGAISDGHSYIANAVTSGARVIVHTKDIENFSNVIYLKVKDSYSAYALLAELFYSYPAKKMKLIGITGTNGKTTTAYLIKSILDSANKKCAFMSTVEYGYCGKYLQATRTTPDAMVFQEFLSKAVDAGCEYLVMEVSSHALVQNRTGSAKFAIAIFTNLSGEHLDYHKNMDSYFSAKYKLFGDHLSDDGVVVVNIDDPYGRKILNLLPKNNKLMSFGKNPESKVRLLDISTSIKGTQISVDYDKKRSFSSSLYGDFNGYNIVSAISVGYALGFDYSVVFKGIESMLSVPGRMEGILLSSGALAIVDYAHTDDALANVLKTLKMIEKIGRLIVVFGCGGDRDKSKRPRMAEVAGAFADEVIITSDNPRTENPKKIIRDITKGLPENIKAIIIKDREEAILKAVSIATKSDIVLVAGKGHENYQEINDIRYPFDDREILKKL